MRISQPPAHNQRFRTQDVDSVDAGADVEKKVEAVVEKG